MDELVYLKNDEPVCSSLQVAEKFGKRHADVMPDFLGMLLDVLLDGDGKDQEG